MSRKSKSDEECDIISSLDWCLKVLALIAFSFIFLHWRQYVSEHDEAVQAGKSEEVTRVTVSVIHDNEAKVEALVQTAATASEELADAKAGGIVLTRSIFQLFFLFSSHDRRLSLWKLTPLGIREVVSRICQFLLKKKGTIQRLAS